MLTAVCQMKVGNNKESNLKKAEELITKSVTQGANIVVLPEIFNSPYQTDMFKEYAEKFGEKTTTFLSDMAKKHNILLVGGSIPECDNGHIFNTSFVFDDKGELIARHRKIHLFDIDIPGKIRFQESETLSPGNDLTIFEYQGITMSVIICYDCRFPELARIATLNGAQVLFIPGAFNMTTGPLHWELIMRSRAVDNQLYVIGASPARNSDASYQAWGHSMIVNPWGTVIAQTDESEGIIIAEIDTHVIERVRTEIPVLKQRRTDLFEINYKR